jgi:hypothetical protein
MKDKDEFLKQMENLQVPDVDTAPHQQKVKMTIMNAERSAALGVWLIVVPSYFLFCVFMYYYFHRYMSWFGAMFTLVVSLDKNPYIDFLAPIVLFVLPIVAIIINALAITHVSHQKTTTKVNELNITIKLKLLNLLLIIISLVIIAIFIGFSMTESISIRN